MERRLCAVEELPEVESANILEVASLEIDDPDDDAQFEGGEDQ